MNKYELVIDGYDDPGQPVVREDFDEESAAESYADESFVNLEYPESVDVFVREQGSSEWSLYHVDVEMSPSFSARLKKTGLAEAENG